ncbi:hydantoinase/oxoprolinase family protein [Exilibacterium tricleocarpae]|uniref:Hydantoinase/oxoprolinase family protein n=1 Tax=Exilibacterium tricleocarpae TaxID=2591008 RepID=A0A545TZB2_9GAMM|nr:hydantoinase/oxoprolinase family protein [Exilibacterium tricleocarpae]TQV82537.1 hydantoinase/oxoprolinase family protein [Exilibacterium tricleocarpae]
MPRAYPYLLGIDTGGTFTDFVLFDSGSKKIRIHKVLSTPAAPEQAILQGVDDMGLSAAIAAGSVVIIHGSTVATNAALEGKGARTVFITNRGLGDMLTIGRQTRRELYNLQPEPRQPPVPAALCLEVDCRLGAGGERLQALTREDLEALRRQVEQRQPEAVAINLLYSFIDSGDEEAIEAVMPAGVFSSRSSFVLPEYKEYERGIATWLNAYLGPLVQNYLQRLRRGVEPAPLGVMQSSGGTIDADQAGRRAVNLLLSGPAGGLAAARFIGAACDRPRLMTFDMGGTSTDVALIDGELKLTSEGHLGPYPVAVPMVDMHTVGAGGGSLAYIDSGGLLQVGPQSAGATPGPACYGLGGTQAAVTDANALLGRLRPDNFLGGAMQLDIEAARNAVGTIAEPLGLDLEATATGIIDIANAHMVSALRVISVQRGYDPRDFQLCCFGGAGGLHVCAIAEALQMRRALVPIHGGVLSALGMLVAPRERQLSRSINRRFDQLTDADLRRQLQALRLEGTGQLRREGVEADRIDARASLDLRYTGQSYTLNVSFDTADRADAGSAAIARAIEEFHRAHQQRYGHRLDIAVELVNIRQRVSAPAEPIQLPPLQAAAEAALTAELPGMGPTAILQREHLRAGTVIDGPALVCEQVSTTLVSPGWQATIDTLGNIVLSCR